MWTHIYCQCHSLSTLIFSTIALKNCRFMFAVIWMPVIESCELLVKEQGFVSVVSHQLGIAAALVPYSKDAYVVLHAAWEVCDETRARVWARACTRTAYAMGYCPGRTTHSVWVVCSHLADRQKREYARYCYITCYMHVCHRTEAFRVIWMRKSFCIGSILYFNGIFCEMLLSKHCCYLGCV